MKGTKHSITYLVIDRSPPSLYRLKNVAQWPVGVVKDMGFGVGSLWFDFRARDIGHSAATPAMFLRSCVALGLNRRDGPRYTF